MEALSARSLSLRSALRSLAQTFGICTRQRRRSHERAAERMNVQLLPSASHEIGLIPAADIRAGDRAALARAITLVESRRADHRAQARDAVRRRCCRTPARRMRIGITGAPGVGKSTFIDALRHDAHRAGHSGSRCWRSIRPRAAPAARSSATRRGWRELAATSGLHPPLAPARPDTLRRRRGEDARGDAGVRGRRLRRGPGRDGRRRPVRDRGLRYDRFLPGADAARRPATTCRASRRA